MVPGAADAHAPMTKANSKRLKSDTTLRGVRDPRDVRDPRRAFHEC
jgi:hypothetical protein